MNWFSVLKEDDDDSGGYYIEKTPEKVKAALDKKNEFKRKKEEVIQEYLNYVDTFGVGENRKLTSVGQLGTINQEGRIFRKVYEKALKDIGILGHDKIKIDYTNYEQFDVDRKISDLRNALENAKEFYKDDIKDFYRTRIRERNLYKMSWFSAIGDLQ